MIAESPPKTMYDTPRNTLRPELMNVNVVAWMDFVPSKPATG